MQSEGRNAFAWVGLGFAAAFGVSVLLQSRRSYHFRGKTVLITGGSRGLGLVLARELAREGARLALLARDEAELRRAEEELRAVAEVFVIPCDVSDRSQVDSAVTAARTRFGGVDVLINNAGLISVGPLQNQTVEDFEQALAVHFWGPLYTTLAVVPEMRARGEGRIVNIASIGGKISVPHLLPYCASKFALVGLSEGLHAELAREGIRVTTVCPGLMRTGSPRNAEFKGRHGAEYTWFTLADSLPGISVSSEKAARQILNACRRGDPELVISLPAVAATLFHGIAPGLTAEILAAVNRILPEPGSSAAVPGKEAETPVTRSWLTGLTQKAAVANNQMESFSSAARTG
jgi:NAD(P)-dependent dehydrogenase (short-subunit alcohol dehydrogenase family)